MIVLIYSYQLQHICSSARLEPFKKSELLYYEPSLHYI